MKERASAVAFIGIGRAADFVDQQTIVGPIDSCGFVQNFQVGANVERC